MKKRGLTPKQERFIEEYMIDLNASAAAVRAGYSQKNADAIGSELLTKIHVADAIRQAKNLRAQRTHITADWVLRELKEIYLTDRAAIYAGGKLKPIDEWPPMMKRLLKVIKKSELQFFGDPVRVLELMGKHVGVKAFSERHEHSGPDGAPIETNNHGTIRIEFVKPTTDGNTKGSDQSN